MSFPSNETQPSPGLQSLIQGSQYRTASEQDLQGVNLNEPVPGNVAQQGQNIGGPAVGQQTTATPVTPATPAAADPTADPRIQQMLFNAAQARIEAEEARFEAELTAQGYSEEEKHVARMEREVEQTRQVNQWLNNQMTQRTEQTRAQQQETAKRMHGFLAATKNGLDFSDGLVRDVLLSARDLNHMNELATNLAQRVGQAHAQHVQQQMTNGVFAAGGNTGNPAPAVKAKERSGDLDSLIQGTGYTVELTM